MQVPDEQLLPRIRQSDEAAFETLFRRYYPMLCRFARKFLPSMADAEELVQDMFTQLWDKRAQLELRTSLRSYLFTAARNRCLNFIKHQNVRAQHEDHVKGAPPNSEADASAAMEQAELKACIDQAISALPDRCREAFRLSRFDGLSYKEIAARMDISPRTVEVQIGKALKILRAELREYFPLIFILLHLFSEKI